MEKNVKINSSLCAQQKIDISEDDYTITFILDEIKLSLTIIDDYTNTFYYKWCNIGTRSFSDFLSKISPYYLKEKIFKREDYILDLPKAKKEFKEIAIRHFKPGLDTFEKGEILSKINHFDYEDPTAWFLFISEIYGIKHSELDYDSYPIPKKLKYNCQKVLDFFENYLQPYLKEQANENK